MIEVVSLSMKFSNQHRSDVFKFHHLVIPHDRRMRVVGDDCSLVKQRTVVVCSNQSNFAVHYHLELWSIRLGT